MKKGDIYILQQDLGKPGLEHFVPEGTEYIYGHVVDGGHFLKTVQRTPHCYGQFCGNDAEFEMLFKLKGE